MKLVLERTKAAPTQKPAALSLPKPQLIQEKKTRKKQEARANNTTAFSFQQQDYNFNSDAMQRNLGA